MSSVFEKTASEPEKVGQIAIRNPHVIDVVASEVTAGTGRNFVEAAENMILADAERRKVERATALAARRPRARRRAG